MSSADVLRGLAMGVASDPLAWTPEDMRAYKAGVVEGKRRLAETRQYAMMQQGQLAAQQQRYAQRPMDHMQDVHVPNIPSNCMPTHTHGQIVMVEKPCACGPSWVQRTLTLIKRIPIRITF